MINIVTPAPSDLAGEMRSHPSYLQVQGRICTLVDNYLAPEKLQERIQDLPLQFHASAIPSLETHQLASY